MPPPRRPSTSSKSSELEPSEIEPREILSFWFDQTTPKQWFIKSDAFDQLIAERFRAVLAAALDGRMNGRLNRRLDGRMDGWANHAEGCLALILVLDQFTRHIYRDSPCAFVGDDHALRLSAHAVSVGWVANCAQVSRRQFFLMPMMHSEDVEVQRASLPLFETYTDSDTLWFAKRHCEIIERFGRFPHRNAVLGRVSTTDEIEFLKEPGSAF